MKKYSFSFIGIELENDKTCDDCPGLFCSNEEWETSACYFADKSEIDDLRDSEGGLVRPDWCPLTEVEE